ncbi:MAG TPA: hypothetical protein VIL33_01950, partial [Rhodothermia bacterium]
MHWTREQLYSRFGNDGAATPELEKTITYLTTGLTLGGAEIQLTRIAIGMKSRGWDVDVVSMLPPEDLVDELKAAEVSVS